MSDPVSLTSAAFGVLSFGIQIFQGLYKYFSAVQNRTKELDTTSQQTQHLIALFQVLQAILPRIDDLSSLSPHTLERLQQCIDDTQAALTLLDNFLQVQGSVQIVTDFKGRLKETARIIIFPIRLKELKRLQEHMKVLVGTVQLAMQIVYTYAAIATSSVQDMALTKKKL
jgi:hypothetical protein